MASIISGPRIGPPRDNQFGLWMRLDTAVGTITLQYRESGTSTWLDGDSGNGDATKINTLILNTPATLEPSTKYEYRVLDTDGTTVLSTNSTWTMPRIGNRFVMCLISDTHGNVQNAYQNALDHFESTYEPLGVPMFILQGGDLMVYGADETLAAASTNIEAELVEAQPCLERIPILYRPDDHDSYGNNCSKDTPGGLFMASEGGNHITLGLQHYSRYWRDMPRPTYGGGTSHMTVATEVGGVPIICVDCRTFRTPQLYDTNPGQNGIYGDNAFDPGSDSFTFLGKDQRDWLIGAINGYSSRKMIFVHTGECWLGQQTAADSAVWEPPDSGPPGQRDSVGLYFKAERNYLLSQLNPMLAYTGQIVWLHGDDHRNAVWKTYYDVPLNAKFGTFPTTAVPWHGYTFIARAGTSDSGVGGSSTLFGFGDILDMEGSIDGAIAFFDITYPEMRITYYQQNDATPSQNMIVYVGTRGGNVGKEGDFFWKNGLLEFYADSDQGAQYFPPDNGKWGVRFERTFIEDIGGIPSRGVTRDVKGRLVSWEEELVDDLDRADELERGDWPRRVEIPEEPL